MKFEGIYTPLVAPFFDDFTLNHDAMQQTVDLLVNAGVHGIIVAGTTGEYYAMSMKERVYMMGVAKEMIAGRVPMIIGTGAIRTEDSVEYARQAKLHDADAILIATPPTPIPRVAKLRYTHLPLTARRICPRCYITIPAG